MSSNRFIRSNRNVIPPEDVPEPLMRCSDAPHESVYHTAHTSGGILVKQSEIMDACTQGLQDRDCEDAEYFLETNWMHIFL